MNRLCSLCKLLVLLGGMAKSGLGQGLSPQDAAKAMTIPDGFEVKVVANEPLVRQPVCIEFDDRGRLWVIQYLQYPNPEGLKRVQVDRYSRTKYDRVPEPPPKGPRGADRITILTDADGDGHYEQGRDFVDGLNLATGLAFGHGGVFVLNVPYLLFYPDRNRDDVPDADPEVLLTGFGMEDAHSVANSLTWGPDGWLYGCQGSTVTANIRGIEFQQGVWRYHPVTKEFELFCEGGGNSWGLDFDRFGRLLYSTNWGGHVLLHAVQGSYLIKAFAKHGALHNPHAYGFFDHAPHENFFGGHVTVAGIVYQGGSFPESFRGKYIAGDLLGHGVYWHNIEPRGSTVKTSHGGELIVANDLWFAPTDVMVGPDGAVYVSDWHDARTAHPDPDADWDRTNGRIYRIAAKGTPVHKPIDFSKISTGALIDLHQHRNQWYVRRARMELIGRKEGAEALKKQLSSNQEQVALEALWSLYSIGGLDESLADELLNSPHPWVRNWTVRFLGDDGQISSDMAHRLDKFAEKEPSVDVRQQIAASAARFPAHKALPMINANINRDIDGNDPYIPLLWWWAVEKHSVSENGREEVMKRFVRPSLWKSHLGSEFLLPRLVRRYMAEGNQAGWDCVVQLVKAAPDDARRDTLWTPLLQGWRDLPRDAKAADRLKQFRNHEIYALVQKRWSEKPSDSTLSTLCILWGDRQALDAAIKVATDKSANPTQRIAALDLIAEAASPALVDTLMAIVTSDQPEAVRKAALRVLGRIDDTKIASSLIALHQSLSADQSPAATAFKSQIRDVMLSRKQTAAAWLEAVDKGTIPATVTPIDQVQKIALLEDHELDALVQKHWGKLSMNRGEKLAEVRRLSNDVRAFKGDLESGHGLFKKHCATCHQLFGEGTKLGPDLTTANRKDREYLLISLVDPSSAIRKEYSSYVVQTKDGRIVTGMAIARDDAGVTLVNAKNEKTTIPASDIDELRESPTSLMPDDLYRQLKPQDLRDLFSYLESNTK